MLWPRAWRVGAAVRSRPRRSRWPALVAELLVGEPDEDRLERRFLDADVAQRDVAACGRVDERRQDSAAGAEREQRGVLERMRLAHVGELGVQQRGQVRRLDVGGNLDDGVGMEGALELGGRIEREQVSVVDD